MFVVVHLYQTHVPACVRMNKYVALTLAALSLQCAPLMHRQLSESHSDSLPTCQIYEDPVYRRQA